MAEHRIIPIYSSRGEVEAFLVFPYLFNKSREWIGCVTSQREVYSVRGAYVGVLTNDPRIVRQRSEGWIGSQRRSAAVGSPRECVWSSAIQKLASLVQKP